MIMQIVRKLKLSVTTFLKCVLLVDLGGQSEFLAISLLLSISDQSNCVFYMESVDQHLTWSTYSLLDYFV